LFACDLRREVLATLAVKFALGHLFRNVSKMEGQGLSVLLGVKTGDYDEAVWDSLALKMCSADEYWEEEGEGTILRESWFIARIYWCRDS